MPGWVFWRWRLRPLWTFRTMPVPGIPALRILARGRPRRVTFRRYQPVLLLTQVKVLKQTLTKASPYWEEWAGNCPPTLHTRHDGSDQLAGSTTAASGLPEVAGRAIGLAAWLHTVGTLKPRIL